MKLQFLLNETRVSSVWNYSSKAYWLCISPLRNYKGYPNGFLLTTIEHVGSVVRDSCGSDLSRLCGLLLLSLLLKFKFGRTILL